MGNADQFRSYARALLARAAETEDAGEKLRLERVALGWSELATAADGEDFLARAHSAAVGLASREPRSFAR